ncbi:DUF262 domain-containing protein [Tabrizicola soli]|uniref:DUF262 domain-containing protein n=1 Tax=Tabrizicola soli TaxID=2185115 RepID=A0ABV7DWQ0_9RHOB|nr:DUF262 domain-containing protein [Tabrizicola soli]
MKIDNSSESIAKILEMLETKELVANHDYQRGTGIWPPGPSSYFIDTILENYPFPKIYIYEFLDPKTKRIKREIVDGQQRIDSITRFRNNEFRLSGEVHYKGLSFSELPEDVQDSFLTYTVSVDVIRNATRSEILQMFRRMNAYTLPLNDAEKRHSEFQGRFKWFVYELAEELNEFFTEYDVFTNKQIVRMADGALITDIVLGMEEGIVSTSPPNLKSLYSKYDKNFPNQELYRDQILSTFTYIQENLDSIRNTFITKQYAMHSLVLALIHNRYGIKAIEDQFGVVGNQEFAHDKKATAEALVEMAGEQEAKILDGNWPKYVWGASSTTDRKARRTARMASIFRALGVTVPAEMDDGLD